MVMLTAAAGFFLATFSSINLALLFHAVFGTGLLASGTAVLNQFLERKPDAKMRRTLRRPLPSGRIRPISALWFGLTLLAIGTLQLVLFANVLTASLGLATSAIYLIFYTPLKARTTACTLIGAVPGAAPPVMGWAAVRGELDIHALILFGILFGWQFPHSLAIAWLYRDDYRRAGFKMLPESSPGISILIPGFALFLICVSLAPVMTGLAGNLYFWGALILGLIFFFYGQELGANPSMIKARRLVRVSVFYLPLLLSLMIIDKL